MTREYIGVDRSLDLTPPNSMPLPVPSPTGPPPVVPCVQRHDWLGGLLHEYTLAA